MGACSLSDLQKIAHLVTEVTGNRVQEKNFSMLESRMSTHLAKLGIASMAEYWEYYARHEYGEREAIQSLMTTHHSFFFREFTHFEVLEKWIHSESERLKIRWEKTKQPLRVWSAAASRGQEVYSLAMFLDQVLREKHGVDFEIVGTDIDRESLEHAKNGVYTIAEVNVIPQNYLNQYWKRGTGSAQDFVAIQSKLKSKVRFEDLNVLTADLWKEKDPFDVIFCRNILIYFSQTDIEKIALSLARRLNPEGLFVTGVSEPLRFPEWNLEILGPSAYARRPKPSGPRLVVNNGPLSKPTTIPETGAKPYKVLCVDDSPTIQALMKKIFSNDPGCAGVEVAVNGNDARKKLDSGKFDLITLDIHMPEVNGIEFLERLYQRDADPPVIMVSSVNRADAELATKSLSLGAFDYVEKPAMNSLQKSTSEILMKAKLALRAGQSSESHLGSFDESISLQVVVPDASQCLRLVVGSESAADKLEQIIRGQKNEYRSPPLLILLKEADGGGLEAKALDWTNRNILSLKQIGPTLKPNHIYFYRSNTLPNLHQLNFKSVSLQIVDGRPLDMVAQRGWANLQVLLDESLNPSLDEIRQRYRFRIGDVTPSISFPSLSAEFFANIRKLAA
jgi:chemotaxis protein methyltransferase CheR